MLLRNSHCNIILIISFFLILSLPTIDNVFKFSDKFPYKLNENRRLSKPPLIKEEGEVRGKLIKKFPKNFESYYNDHFGLRNLVITAGNKISTNNIISNKYVLSQDDWIFLDEAGMFKEMMGLVKLNKNQIDQAVSNLYNNWQSLKKQNIDYLFVLLPNKQSVYPEYLPKYVYSAFQRRSDKSTRIDQIIDELLSRYPNFPILDLRSTFIDAKQKDSRASYDKTDTHWNGLGIKYAYDEIYKYLKERSINIKKTDFALEEHYINKGGLSNITGRYPYYYSTRAKVENPTYKKVENSKIVTKVNNIIKSYYKNHRNLQATTLYSNSLISNKTKIYSQHDSFFHSSRMQPFLANSFNQSLFVWHIRSRNINSCQAHIKAIEFYKPDIAIHAMVERIAVQQCIK